MRIALSVATSAAALSRMPSSGTCSLAHWACALLCSSLPCALAPPASCGLRAGHVVSPQTLRLKRWR
eukprot:11927455-Alexandrium_andersonii.AAC.1